MGPTLNHCLDDGYVVGASYDIPDDPSAYHSDHRDIIGCNQLICARCHAHVRFARGLFPDVPRGVDWRVVHELPDWSTLEWMKPGDGTFYACRCMGDIEFHARAADQLELSGILWRCGGHPPGPLPVEIDGVAITRFTDLPRLLRQSATGGVELPIRKIRARLAGTPLEASVDGVMEGFLKDEDPRIRRAALGFYWAHPHARGAATVLSLAKGDRALFAGVPDEALSEGGDLEARLVLTLGSLWMEGTVDPGAARDVIRAEALRPGRARPTFASLATMDTGWLMANARDIFRATADGAGKLLVELERMLGPDPRILELAGQVSQENPAAVARIRSDIETYCTSELRDPLLAIFAGS
jgi:hypothetical protein